MKQITDQLTLASMKPIVVNGMGVLMGLRLGALSRTRP